MDKKIIDYFGGDELAANVWFSKYKLDNEQTPDDMWKRIIGELTNTELERIVVLSSEQENDLSPHGKERYTKLIEGNVQENLIQLYNDYIGFDGIVPGGSMMQGIGNHEFYSSLSNCFVLGSPYDSYSGILQKDFEQTQVMMRRGGAGTDLSSVRPEGAKVNNQSQFSCGPVLFATRYSNTTLEVSQKGRRGAAMLSMRCEHPNSLEFAKEKQDLTKLTGCNSSIIYSDEFMEAVINDTNFIQQFPVNIPLERFKMQNAEDMNLNQLYQAEYFDDNTLTYKLGYLRKISAKDFWALTSSYATKTAEPGVLFLGNWKSGGTDYVYSEFRPVSTNPCSEIPMQPYDSCRLLSLNIYVFVDNPFTENAKFNFDRAYKYCYEQLNILDVAIDLEIKYINRIIDKIKNSDSPIELKDAETYVWYKIQQQAIRGRRAGAGFTGIGDTLAALGLKYDDSEKTMNFLNDLFRTKMLAELDATIDMAIMYGSFVGFDFEKEFSFDNINQKYVGNNKIFQTIVDITDDNTLQKLKKYGRRNVSWSTAAPTGSLSLLTQTTSGIEPLFSPYHMRRKKCILKTDRVDYVDPADGQKFTVYPIFHPKLKLWIELNGGKTENLSEEEVVRWFKKSPWCGSKAEDINWKQRVNVQALVQKYTTHAISSTINLPSNTTSDVVSEIYLESWKKGLKGNTVYRDGSRGGILVNTKSETQENKNEFESSVSPKRPKILKAVYHTIKTRNKIYSVVIGFYCNKPYEIFIASDADDLLINFDPHVDFINGTIIKEDKNYYNFITDIGEILVRDLQEIETKELKSLSLMMSMSMRHRTPLKYIIKTLEKTQPMIGDFNNQLIKILSKYVPDKEKTGNDCPNTECDGELEYRDGCVICPICGWTKC